MICLATTLFTLLLPAAAVPTDAAPEIPVAVADGEPHRILSAWVDVGLGAPTGYLGGRLEARLVPEFALSVHAGTGKSGAQVGMGLRGYVYSASSSGPEISIVVDVAYAAGFKTGEHVHEFAAGVWHWAHLGAGAVFRPAAGDSGLAVEVLVGASTIVDGPGDGAAHVDWGDITIARMSPGTIVGPWLQLGLGWVF